ncbi:hypothetical protein OH492_27465 [Vibrio chagasii]|nr:hypothetical protein [Vibrio chagasii]
MLQSYLSLGGLHRNDGRTGLTDATKVAILNANYVMEKLRPALLFFTVALTAA